MDQLLDTLTEAINTCEREQTERPLAELKIKYQRLRDAAKHLARASSGSWNGFHAFVYKSDLQPAGPGQHFDSVYGGADPHLNTTRGKWEEFDYQVIEEAIYRHAGEKDCEDIKTHSQDLSDIFVDTKRHMLPILDALVDEFKDSSLADLRSQLKELPNAVVPVHYVNSVMPKSVVTCQSMLGQGTKAPHHITFLANLDAHWSAIDHFDKLIAILNHAKIYVENRRELMRTRNAGTTEESPLPVPTYNITGQNSRVNIDSHDQSTTVVNIEENKVFVKLRDVIHDKIPSGDRENILDCVDELVPVAKP